MIRGNQISRKDFLEKCHINQSVYKELKDQYFISQDEIHGIDYYESNQGYGYIVVVKSGNSVFNEEIEYRVFNKIPNEIKYFEVEICSYQVFIGKGGTKVELLYQHSQTKGINPQSNKNVLCKAYIRYNNQIISFKCAMMTVQEEINRSRNIITAIASKKYKSLYKNIKVILNPMEEVAEENFDSKEPKYTVKKNDIITDMEIQLLKEVDEILPSSGWTVNRDFKEKDEFIYKLEHPNENDCTYLIFKVIANKISNKEYTFDIKLYDCYRSGYYIIPHSKLEHRKIHVNYGYERANEKYYVSICNNNKTDLSIVFPTEEMELKDVINMINVNYEKLKKQYFSAGFELVECVYNDFNN